MSPNASRDIAALLALVEDRMRAAFAWGSQANDCVSFAAAAIQAQTGVDRLRSVPDWTTARGAARVLKRLGGLEAAVNTVLSPIAAAHAARGDIALVQGETGPALMVVEGETLVGPGASGLVRLPRSAMLRAWSAV